MSKALDTVLNGLMSRYQARVPDVAFIMQAMLDEGLIASFDEIENDHIAFRTLGVPYLGIASFEKIFLHYGYEKRDPNHFSHKKLDAYWYSPPSPEYPRIFVSELRVQDLSEEAQRIIASYTNAITSDPVDAIDLNNGEAVDAFLHTSLWNLPTLSDFETLERESEYAAWVIYNRYYLNHFTVSVHNLPAGFNTVALFNDFLESKGRQLNDAGGKVKTSSDGLLKQSSTVAEMIKAEFSDKKSKMISGSYVEFAERLPLEPSDAAFVDREDRRDGFEAANADKIFESTYSTQTSKA